MSGLSTKLIEDLDDPEEGAVWRRMPRSFSTRRRLKLTVEEYAERYRIPAELQRAWEAGTAKPDAVAEAFMLAIAREPELMAKVLAPREPVAQAPKRVAAE
jgi:hypothetical protein